MFIAYEFKDKIQKLYFNKTSWFYDWYFWSLNLRVSSSDNYCKLLLD